MKSFLNNDNKTLRGQGVSDERYPGSIPGKVPNELPFESNEM
jgi:hypothetical protein